MNRIAFFGLLLWCVAGAAASQSPLSQPTEVTPDVQLALDVHRATSQDIGLRVEQQRAEFWVRIDGVVRRVRLWPQDVRAAGFTLRVDSGSGVATVVTPPSVTWRGRVEGQARSDAAVTIVDAQVRGLIRLEGDGDFIAVQPLAEFDPHAPTRFHVVHRSSAAIVDEHRCGNLDGPMRPASGPLLRGLGALKIAEIACEGDASFTSRAGGATGAHNEITGIINAMNVIYERDVSIRYAITNILVRSGSDPYSTSDASGLLGQFRNWWNNNQSSVTRDVAHLFTGRNLNGSTIGIAAVGVICTRSRAYGLSQSYFSSNFNRRVALTCHELGHNWRASHCDQGGGCRIMCQSLGGCSGIVTSFNQTAIGQVIAFKQNRGCLTAANPPQITSLQPSTVTSVFYGPVAIIGQNLDTATEIQIDNLVLRTGDFRVISDTRLEFTPGVPTRLGTVPVSVTTQSGTSPAAQMTWVANSPPDVFVPPIFVAGSPFIWQCGGNPGSGWFLLIGFQPTTAPFLGFDFLVPNLLVAQGTLDSVGRGLSVALTSPGALSGAFVYSQVVTTTAGSLQLEGVGPLRSTFFF